MSDSAKHIATVEGSAKSTINFNGTGTISIRESYNVSSLTDRGVGLYTVNLINAMANTTYSPLGNVNFSGGATDLNRAASCVESTSSAYFFNAWVQSGGPSDNEFNHGHLMGILS